MGHAAYQASDHFQVGRVERRPAWRITAESGQGETTAADGECGGAPGGIGLDFHRLVVMRLAVFELRRKLQKCLERGGATAAPGSAPSLVAGT